MIINIFNYKIFFINVFSCRTLSQEMLQYLSRGCCQEAQQLRSGGGGFALTTVNPVINQPS